jgi:cell division protein FtsL
VAESFEYAIRKDVRNNPIVREVDEARQRELWKSVAVAGVLVIVLLFSVWQRVQLLKNGYQVDELQKTLAAAEQARRQLQLDVDVLKAPDRIEEYAIERLHLAHPSSDEAVIIERVVPAERPASSVVARW